MSDHGNRFANIATFNDVFPHLSVEDAHPLWRWVGQRVKFPNPTCGDEYHIFTITGCQKTYDGRTIWRGHRDGDVFGRPLDPTVLEFVDLPYKTINDAPNPV